MNKNLFLESKDQRRTMVCVENKGQRKPMVCVRKHKPAYVGHTLRTQAQVCIHS